MNRRALTLLGAGTAALALGVGILPPVTAGADSVRPLASTVAVPHSSVPPDIGQCYNQSNNNGVGIVSQNFESGLDALDSRGAVDFRLGSSCRVQRLIVIGEYFNGSGPADSVNVTFYRNFDGLPGGVISNQEGLSYDDEGSGLFAIDLATTVGLQAKRYWVSVQFNVNVVGGGEWDWITTTNQVGYQSAWRNVGNGYGTGCVHYTALRSCLPNGEGPDFTVVVEGR